MKIMRLASGLGNSMFQYATYLQLKKMYPREKIYVDTIWYDYTGYPYELDEIFHLNTDKIDFHKLLERKYGIEFEKELEKLKFWKDFGYSSFIEMVKAAEKQGNHIISQMSFIELPQLYLPYVNGLSIESQMQLTIRELKNNFPNFTEHDLLNYKGKIVGQVEKNCDNVAVKYLVALLMKTKRKKIINDVLHMKKPDLTGYPSLETLKREGYVYFNNYGGYSSTIGVKEELYKAFVFPNLVSKENINMAKMIHNKESVAIHARVNTFDIFMEEILNRNYYKRAVRYLKKKIDRKLTFFVFSDDLNWCRENIQLLGINQKEDDIYFVRGGVGKESYRDMQLISICKHAIIPGSTFAWWGTYLNKNPQKIIVTPYGTFPGTISF